MFSMKNAKYFKLKVYRNIYYNILNKKYKKNNNKNYD